MKRLRNVWNNYKKHCPFVQKQISTSTNSTPSSKNSSDINTLQKNLKDEADTNVNYENPLENITVRQKYDSMSYYIANGLSDTELMSHKELNLTNETSLRKSMENLPTDSKSFYRSHTLSNHLSPHHLRYDKVVVLYISMVFACCTTIVLFDCVFVLT